MVLLASFSLKLLTKQLERLLSSNHEFHFQRGDKFSEDIIAFQIKIIQMVSIARHDAPLLGNCPCLS